LKFFIKDRDNTIKSLQDSIIVQEKVLKKNVDLENVEDLKEKLIISERELIKSAKRNDDQKDIIDKLKGAEIHAKDKIQLMEDQIIAQERLISQNVDEENVENLQERLVLSERELLKNQSRNTILQNMVNKLNAEAINAASDTNYMRLQEENKSLEEGKKNNEREIKRMGRDLKMLWDQLTKASDKGYDILSPAQLQRKMKEQQEDKSTPKPQGAGPARNGWFSNKIGPRSYII